MEPSIGEVYFAGDIRKTWTRLLSCLKSWNCPTDIRICPYMRIRIYITQRHQVHLLTFNKQESSPLYLAIWKTTHNYFSYIAIRKYRLIRKYFNDVVLYEKSKRKNPSPTKSCQSVHLIRNDYCCHNNKVYVH